MSAENVDVVRRIYAAAARRDSATVMSLYDPDVELDNTRLGLAGHRGERAEVAFHVAVVWTVRAGKVVRVVWWPTREEALASVGQS